MGERTEGLERDKWLFIGHTIVGQRAVYREYGEKKSTQRSDDEQDARHQPAQDVDQVLVEDRTP